MFRVEKLDGTGPYFSGDADLEQMMFSHGDAEHPSPADDPMLGGIYPDEVCGFPTLCALEEWFSGYEDPLDAAGYQIAVYTVELQRVRYGKSQAVFVRDADMMPVRTMPVGAYN